MFTVDVKEQHNNNNIVEQGPIILAVEAGVDCSDIFLSPVISLSFLLLWQTLRYRQKYCPKELYNPKQPTNHPFAMRRYGSKTDFQKCREEIAASLN